MKQRYVLTTSLLSQSNSPQRKYKNQKTPIKGRSILVMGSGGILEGKVNLNAFVLKTEDLFSETESCQ